MIYFPFFHHPVILHFGILRSDFIVLISKMDFLKNCRVQQHCFTDIFPLLHLEHLSYEQVKTKRKLSRLEMSIKINKKKNIHLLYINSKIKMDTIIGFFIFQLHVPVISWI